MTSPVPGYGIGTPYGKPGSWAAGYHTGNDYPAPAGKPVVATRAGKVTKAQYDGDYGNRVEILTGDVEHSYSHLSAFSVSVGQQVAEGQQVGQVGSTGNSTGPHCHYEERTSPYGYSDDRKPQFDITSGGAPPPSGGGWSSGDVYQSKLYPGSNGDAGEGSDSVRRMQTVLNEWSFEGGQELPITGFYGPDTQHEVGLFQSQVCGDPADGAIGPKQTDKLFTKLGPWNLIR
jgi:murein DD-endopeptidase MepM/ murein hydrolase activator NlpD